MVMSGIHQWLENVGGGALKPESFWSFKNILFSSAEN
jgi:hypothetical protein